MDRLAATGGIIAERVTDITDIRDRVICHLLDRPMPGVPKSDKPFVLVAHDLAPAEAATLTGHHCLGIVTAGGGPTSHTSVLARSLGIPAVVGFADALGIPDGAEVLVDGSSGEVVVSPSESQRAGARTSPAPLEALGGPGSTRDGVPVPLLANVGSPPILRLRQLPARRASACSARSSASSMPRLSRTPSSSSPPTGMS